MYRENGFWSGLVLGMFAISFIMLFTLVPKPHTYTKEKTVEIVSHILKDLDDNIDEFRLIDSFDGQMDITPMLCFKDNPYADCIMLEDLINYYLEAE
jgi:hypothetical protein